METSEQVDQGDKVKHPKFGQGTVTMKLGDGENAKVIVKFGSEVGEKKLLLKYAKLRKVGERPTLAAGAEAAQEPEKDKK
jgi:DNA helicase II / ATP-dependent DNA helicase PcrA